MQLSLISINLNIIVFNCISIISHWFNWINFDDHFKVDKLNLKLFKLNVKLINLNVIKVNDADFKCNVECLITCQWLIKVDLLIKSSRWIEVAPDCWVEWFKVYVAYVLSWCVGSWANWANRINVWNCLRRGSTRRSADWTVAWELSVNRPLILLYH